MIDTECPFCEKDTEANIGVSDLGLPVTCPHCKRVSIVIGDYCDGADDSNWWLSLGHD